MKNISKSIIVIVAVALSSCTSSKLVTPAVPTSTQKSYKLPSCHKAIHDELLKNQHKMIFSSVWNYENDNDETK